MARPAHIKGMGVVHAVQAVPSGDHRDPQHLNHPLEYVEGLSDADSVSGVDHRTLRLSYLLHDLSCQVQGYGRRKKLSLLSLSGLILGDHGRLPLDQLSCTEAAAVTAGAMDGPSGAACLIIVFIKAQKLLCLHICALDV